MISVHKIEDSNMEKLKGRVCPVCGHKEPLVFYEASGVPIFCNVLLSSPEKAKQVPISSIQLGLCTNCSLVFNYGFDESLLEYNPNYENSLNFSGRFRLYATKLAEDLVKRYNLYNKQIIEIGCGQADFLSMLCQLGDNHGTGFDPSYDPKNVIYPSSQSLNIITEPYSEIYNDIHADFVCSRHVLEHINNPTSFLSMIRNTIGDDKKTVLYFEVPNALYTISNKVIWSIIYEHCCYFTSYSLENVFRKSGFQPLNISTGYEEQFLRIEAVPTTPDNHEFAKPSGNTDLLKLVENFEDSYKTKVQFWKDTLSKSNQRTVLWGAGSKGITFLNTLNVNSDTIEYIVDLNPRKWGLYIPRTGQEVVKPDFLRGYRPDIILVTNPIYQDEIKKIIHDLEIDSKILHI